MRRTITTTAASIGLVIAFVIGGVALAARPAAAGPTATRCIGIDLRVTNGDTGGSDPSGSTPSGTSLDPGAGLSGSPSTSANAIFPPDPEVELCGPIVIVITP